MKNILNSLDNLRIGSVILFVVLHLHLEKVKKQFLSIEDLQSSIDDNGLVTYFVGNYVSVDNAINEIIEAKNEGPLEEDFIEEINKLHASNFN